MKLTTGDGPPSAVNRFVISSGTPGTFWLSQVSLFPPTYNDRPNGNRIDIMQKLVDMKPTFLRFPGGNYVEGRDMPNRFDWKKTIHSLEQRPGHMSPGITVPATAWGCWNSSSGPKTCTLNRC